MFTDLLIRIIADGLVFMIVIVGAIAFVVPWAWDYQRFTRAFLAGLTAYTLGKLMSLVYQTSERPFVTLGLEAKAAYLNNPGFPSDHALFVTAIALIILLGTRHRKVGLILVALSCIIAAGRVAALVHTPLDVTGGIVAAIVGVSVWYRVPLRRLLTRRPATTLRTSEEEAIIAQK